MMKQLYHVCYSSPDEVMFRDEYDFCMYINVLGLRACSDDIDLIADAELTEHVHECMRTDNPRKKVGYIRHSYTSHFNARYHRTGRLGEEGCFCSLLQGPRHITACLSYVLRNGLHHGLAASAFGYKYSSIHEMFRKELKMMQLYNPEAKLKLPRKSIYPEEYKMDDNGIFLRSSFMEIGLAESYFISPRNFLYMMNRLSDDRWKNEQLVDNTSDPPITLAEAEPTFLEKEIAELADNESGRKYDPSKMDDLALCHLIDKQIVPLYNARSIYDIPRRTRCDIANDLAVRYHLPRKQIARCMVV